MCMTSKSASGWQERLNLASLFQKNSAEKLSAVLERLTEVEGFEQFLHRTFVGQKRFSIEGLDALVPVLDDIIAQSVKSGTTSVNIGMAHRGRLNVLAHVLGKPYEIIFSEFQHAPNKDLVPSEGSIGISYGWTGDVKYHLGANREPSRRWNKISAHYVSEQPEPLGIYQSDCWRQHKSSTGNANTKRIPGTRWNKIAGHFNPWRCCIPWGRNCSWNIEFKAL